jgi:hypothetical protein
MPEEGLKFCHYRSLATRNVAHTALGAFIVERGDGVQKVVVPHGLGDNLYGKDTSPVHSSNPNANPNPKPILNYFNSYNASLSLLARQASLSSFFINKKAL